MIKNERQHRITRSRADDLRRSLVELDNADPPEGLAPEMRQLQLEALRSVLADLEAELADYDSLRDATQLEATGLDQLPMALIRARIARGLTQRQLADRLGLTEQAIQRYEANDYAGVSFARLIEIADALQIIIRYDIRLSEAG